MSEPNDRRAELVAMLERLVYYPAAATPCFTFTQNDARDLLALLDRPAPAPVTTSREFGEAVFALHSLDKPSPVAAPDLARLAAEFDTAVKSGVMPAASAMLAYRMVDALEWAAGLQRALERIESWEMPPTGQFWSDGTPMSHSACYGSNGERDVIRAIARVALLAPGEAGEKSTTKGD